MQGLPPPAGGEMTILVGRKAILVKLQGIKTWKTAKKFLKRNKISLQHDECGRPIVQEEDLKIQKN